MPVLHIAEERGEVPTVLLLHGIASSSVTFHHVIPLLERTHRCIAIDLLGFGESPAPEWADYTLADHVAASERTVASLRLREPFTVVGHSMGALIGARYAARRQKRVAKLVMVSPPRILEGQLGRHRVHRLAEDLPHQILDRLHRLREVLLELRGAGVARTDEHTPSRVSWSRVNDWSASPWSALPTLMEGIFTKLNDWSAHS